MNFNFLVKFAKFRFYFYLSRGKYALCIYTPYFMYEYAERMKNGHNLPIFKTESKKFLILNILPGKVSVVKKLYCATVSLNMHCAPLFLFQIKRILPYRHLHASFISRDVD